MPSFKHSGSALQTPVFFVLIFCLLLPTLVAADNSESVNDSGKKAFIAYYFHNDYRCASCLRIEKWSEEIIRQAFAEKLKTGIMEWKPVNTDLPENRHYEKDYRLYTKTLIISESMDGKETRWKNLEKVWHYLNNEEKFKSYVQSELQAFMTAE